MPNFDWSLALSVMGMLTAACTAIFLHAGFSAVRARRREEEARVRRFEADAAEARRETAELRRAVEGVLAASVPDSKIDAEPGPAPKPKPEPKPVPEPKKEAKPPVDHSGWAHPRGMSLSGTKLSHEPCRHGGWRTQATLDPATLYANAASGLLAQGWNLVSGEAGLLSCRGCSACLPSRIDVLVPFSRRERRALAPFLDGGSIQWSDASALDDEHLSLAMRHRLARLGEPTAPDADSVFRASVKESWTKLVSLRDKDGVLRAFIVVALHARGAVFARMHAFDPDGDGSLGTAAICAVIRTLRPRSESGWTHLYLGHTEAGIWDYKTRFAGSEILADSVWVRSKDRPAVEKGGRGNTKA